MCGINGIFAYHYAANPVDGAELLRTRDYMKARGPDAAGAWMKDDGRVGFGPLPDIVRAKHAREVVVQAQRANEFACELHPLVAAHTKTPPAAGEFGDCFGHTGH